MHERSNRRVFSGLFNAPAVLGQDRFYPAVRTAKDRTVIRSDLVADQVFGRKETDRALDPRALGKSRQNVRVYADLGLRDPVIHGGKLTPLVDHRRLFRRSDPPAKIAQNRRLRAQRRAENQQSPKVPLRRRFLEQVVRDPDMLAGDPKIDRGIFADHFRLSRRPRKPRAVTAAEGNTPLGQLPLTALHGIAAKALHTGFQLRRLRRARSAEIACAARFNNKGTAAPDPYFNGFLRDRARHGKQKFPKRKNLLRRLVIAFFFFHFFSFLSGLSSPVFKCMPVPKGVEQKNSPDFFKIGGVFTSAVSVLFRRNGTPAQKIKNYFNSATVTPASPSP